MFWRHAEYFITNLFESRHSSYEKFVVMQLTVIPTDNLEYIAGLVLTHVGKWSEEIDSWCYFHTMGDPTPKVIRFMSVSCVDSQNEIISRSSSHSSPQQASDDDVDNLFLLRNMRQVKYSNWGFCFWDIDPMRIIFSDCVLRVITTNALVVVLVVIAIKRSVTIFDTIWQSL